MDMDNLKPRCPGKRVVVKLFVHDNCHRQVFANLMVLNHNTAQITHWIAVVVYNIYQKQGKTQHTAVI